MKLQLLGLIVNERKPLAEAHVNLLPLLMEEEKPFLTFSFQMLYGHLSLGYTKQELLSKILGNVVLRLLACILPGENGAKS